MFCMAKKYRWCDPVKLIKFFILFICGVFTVMQVSECVNKLFHPPVSTHYFYLLNDTIRYPSVTVCRKPSYKTWLFPKYGLYENTQLDTHRAFEHFNFNTHSLDEFMEETTYNFQEVFRGYAYAGIGSNKNLNISETYHLSRGRCYTLTPLVKSDRFSMAGGYFFYLFFNESDLSSLVDNGFEIFLHDPNEMLTHANDQKDSFLNGLLLESGENMEVLLDVSEFHKLSTTNLPCISEDLHSKSKCQEMCVHLQVASKANCTAPWLILPNGYDFPLCDNYTKIRDLIIDFRNTRESYLDNCHCYMACNIYIFTPTIIKRKDETLNAPSSTINLYFATNLVSVMREMASYDWNQFVSDVGGSLGFLLGLSVLSLMCLMEQIFQIIFRQMFSRVKKQEEENERLENKTTNNVVVKGNEDEKNNTKKSEETDEVKVEHDYKHIKDFTTDYRLYENNIFNNEKNDQFKTV